MKLLLLCLILMIQETYAGAHVRNQWAKKELRVCFVNEGETDRLVNRHRIFIRNWNSKTRKLVKAWVTEEFSIDKTGIQFIGWSDCRDELRPDVVLYSFKVDSIKAYFTSMKIGITESLGPSRDEINYYSHARNAVALSNVGLSKGLVVHEFGHVLGLAHENTHYLAKDESCEEIKPNYSSLLIYTPFDKASVMNYCTLRENAHSGLSEDDKTLLKRLYR